MSRRHPCPCCGHLILEEMPGSYAICPICFWEDDAVQFRWPTMDGGANKVSLIEAQHNYRNFGACDQHGRRFVRRPAADEPLDLAWRPIDLKCDSFEVWGAKDWAPWPADPSVLC
ncbi:CPCC family cysteine-rich protein [Streptomyces sp. NPDC058424]|uniref:CPCC family cysteine-rich protein n=1 Tax=Streptomyces sp. NPDC058424 TaxID=3346491 RepID=UPI003664D714